MAHETAVPSVAVLSLQTRLEAIQSVPGRVVVGRRAGDDGDAIVDIDELHRVELVGPGAEGAARALMVSFLAHHGIENGQVVVATSPEGALIAAAEGTPGLRLLEPAQLLDHLEARSATSAASSTAPASPPGNSVWTAPTRCRPFWPSSPLLPSNRPISSA